MACADIDPSELSVILYPEGAPAAPADPDCAAGCDREHKTGFHCPRCGCLGNEACLKQVHKRDGTHLLKDLGSRGWICPRCLWAVQKEGEPLVLLGSPAREEKQAPVLTEGLMGAFRAFLSSPGGLKSLGLADQEGSSDPAGRGEGQAGLGGGHAGLGGGQAGLVPDELPYSVDTRRVTSWVGHVTHAHLRRQLLGNIRTRYGPIPEDARDTARGHEHDVRRLFRYLTQIFPLFATVGEALFPLAHDLMVQLECCRIRAKAPDRQSGMERALVYEERLEGLEWTKVDGNVISAAARLAAAVKSEPLRSEPSKRPNYFHGGGPKKARH